MKTPFNPFLLLALIVTPACQAAPPRPETSATPCRYVAKDFGPPGTAPLQVEKIATGLVVPWGLAFLPNKDLLVTERDGRVRLIQKGKLLPKPIATLDVDQRSEAGLLGLALHPQFPKEPWVYFYYTAKNAKGDPINRVQRYQLNADGTQATPERVLIDNIPAAQYHSGGRLRFGPDGNLYIGTGDSRVPDLSQQVDSLAGKILRITPDGKFPRDNPWRDTAVYIVGVRNVQGFDWLDKKTMIISDHGPSGELRRTGGDELSLAKIGENLGWPEIWGCQTGPGMVTPLIAWKDAAPPGGLAYLQGSAWVGTLGSRHLQRVVMSKDSQGRMHVSANETYLLGDPPEGYGRLREVIVGPDQQLYVTTSNCDDRGTCGSEKDMVLRISKLP